MTRVEIITKALTSMKDDCNYSLAIHSEYGNYFKTELEKIECEDTIIKIDEIIKEITILDLNNLNPEK